MAQKASIAEYEIRVDTVAEMLVKGCKRPEILRYSANTWNINIRQTDEYIANARVKIDEANSESLKEQIALALATLNDLKKKNYQIQDYREVRAVQESINKLLGIDAPKKLDLTTKGESVNQPDYSNLTTDEKIKLFELLNKTKKSEG